MISSPYRALERLSFSSLFYKEAIKDLHDYSDSFGKDPCFTSMLEYKKDEACDRLDEKVLQRGSQGRFASSFRHFYALLDRSFPSERFWSVSKDTTLFSGNYEASQALVFAAEQLSVPEPLQSTRNFFTWMQTSLTYDPNCIGRSMKASEVFEERRGVCIDFAYLYASLCRLDGLEAFVYDVFVDALGNKLYPPFGKRHACAGVYLEGELTLVDVTYHTYDISHKKFSFMY